MTGYAQKEIEPVSRPLIATRHIQLLLLTVAAMTGIYARTVVGPLQETMRIALSLSDNQMALLQGAALALPLTVIAIPLGLAVDRYSRVRLLLIAAVVNMVASFATAMASDFAMLFAARCLVGFAAPATAIAAFSVLSDLYAPAQRGRAAMIIVLGQAGGSSAAFALGGWLLAASGTDPDGWRWSAFCMGALMVPFILLLLALREPPRTGSIIKRPALREVSPELWRYRRVIGTLLVAVAFVNVADGAALVWAAPTLSRSLGVPPDRMGAIMAMALLIGGALGPIMGGTIADLCQGAGGARRSVSVLCALALLSIPAAAFAMMPGVTPAGVQLTLFLTIGTAISVMTTAVSIVVIPNELRGLIVSIKTAAAVLFGLGLAPLAVSVLSGAMGGEQMIGRSLAIVCVSTSLLAAAAFAWGRRYFPSTAVS